MHRPRGIPAIVILASGPAGTQLWCLRGGEPAARTTLELPIAPLPTATVPHLRLRATPSGSLWLRLPFGPRVPAARLGHIDEQLCLVPPVPGAGRIALHSARAQPGDTVAVLDDRRLWVLDGPAWRAVELPAYVSARQASVGPDGVWWVAGARRAGRVGRSDTVATICRLEPGSVAFRSATPRLGPLAAVAVARRRGLDALHDVDAEDAPVVAVADGGAEPVSFVYARTAAGRWVAGRVGQLAARIVRPAQGRVSVVAADGTILDVAAGGRLRGHPPAGLHRLLRCVAGVDPDARFLVRGADALGDTVVLAVGAYRLTGPRLVWTANAVVRSRDAGATWSILAATAPAAGEPELPDAAILRPG
ncbi:MAG TPA: hypothetical protein VES42_06970 [Pilimelia sp.]|nr:hypothetical protein [Pilimelia sp.]